MGVLQNEARQGLQSVRNQRSADLYTIEAGQLAKRSNQLLLDPKVRVAAIRNSPDQVHFDFILDVAMIVDELSYARTTYDNIMRQRLFGLLYQSANRALAYIDGTAPVSKVAETIPCHVCGLVLPLSHITIDHTRPQTGGKLEAVAKVLRVLDLTVGGPTGGKAAALQNALGTASKNPQGLGAGLHHLQMNVQLPPLPTTPGRAPKAAAQHSLEDRYTLNFRGQLVYSTLIEVGCGAELDDRCMNSLINLRPLCGPCNSARGNPTKF